MPSLTVLKEIVDLAKLSLDCVRIVEISGGEKILGLYVGNVDFSRLIAAFSANEDGNVCDKCQNNLRVGVRLAERCYPEGLCCYTFVKPLKKTVLDVSVCAKCLNSALGMEGVIRLLIFVDKHVLPLASMQEF